MSAEVHVTDDDYRQWAPDVSAEWAQACAADDDDPRAYPPARVPRLVVPGAVSL